MYQSMFKKQQTSKMKQGIYGYCLENLFKNSTSSLRGRMLVFLKYERLSCSTLVFPREVGGKGSPRGVLTQSGTTSL